MTPESTQSLELLQPTLHGQRGRSTVLRLRIGAGLLLTVCTLMAVLWDSTTGYPSALEPPPVEPGALRIDHVRLLSIVPGSPKVEEDQSVIVDNGKVVAVGLTGTLQTPRRLSESLRTIDATGLTLAPGLIDAHVHVWDEAELAGYLAHGVTAIRNMSGMPWHIALSERLKAEG